MVLQHYNTADLHSVHFDFSEITIIKLLSLANLPDANTSLCVLGEFEKHVLHQVFFLPSLQKKIKITKNQPTKKTKKPQKSQSGTCLTKARKDKKCNMT